MRINQPMQMMHRMLREIAARRVDEEAAAVVGHRVQAALHVFDQADVFGAEHVAEIAGDAAGHRVELAVRGVDGEHLVRGFRGGGADYFCIRI